MDLRGYANLLELWLYYNALAEVDLAHCPRLTTLGLHSNQLQRLDLSKHLNLTVLDLS